MCESMMKSLGFVNFVLFHEVKEAVASLEKQMSKVLGIQLPKLTLLCESDTRSLTTPPILPTTSFTIGDLTSRATGSKRCCSPRHHGNES